MALITKTIAAAVTAEITGSDVADLFWDLSEVGQALFFNHLSHFKEMSFQLQEVSQSEFLTQPGRQMMAKIGEYSSRQ